MCILFSFSLNRRKMTDEKTVDTSKVSIRLINKNVAKEMIVKYHYSHKWSLCKYALGVFYKSEDEDSFFAGETETLIGVLVYGHPVGAQALKSVIETLNTHEVLELTRLFIHDGYGKNIESYSIGKSIKWLKKNATQIKMLLSYADPERGHLGGIYKATNWLYQGCGEMKLMPNYSLGFTPDGPWMHSRTVGMKYGSTNEAHLKKVVGRTFWLKTDANKHRYLQFTVGKKERKKLIKQLKHPIMPYVTEYEHKIVIRKMEIDNKETFEY